MTKFKILIADDEVYIIKDIIHILMKNPDYIIYTTGDGKSACEIVNLEYPDLIIMDWEMPVMSGIEAIKLLKQNEVTRDIPVIVATGVMLDSTDLSLALISGAVDYIRKPIDEVELTARVDNMLRSSSAYLMVKQQNNLMQSQLTSWLVNIQQLNELKTATIKHLSIIKKETSDADNSILHGTIAQAEHLLYSKAYTPKWDDFESHLEIVYQGFLKKLKNYGDFTRYELRLCAFIKLSMSNKEIAAITYTSPNSVNTARKRLKKKINLQPEDSLQLFIRNL